MTGRTAGRTGTDTLGQARGAVAREAWAEAHRLLRALDTTRLTPDDHAGFADAAWWTSRVDESIEQRTLAYSGYAASGADRRAGLMAWLLFYEHQLAGRPSVAAGWLRRARRHLGGEPECVEQCYLVWVDTEAAQARGAFDEAMASALRMAAIARRCGSPDLYTMSVQARASVLVARGRIAEGLDVLDEAMCSAAAGELSAFFTGWVYCLGLQQCMACVDLHRAAEWTDAAMRWCASMPAENNFRGLCRLHRVQVLELRGHWSRALDEAVRTCEELLPYERRSAAEVFYLLGEILRRRGETQAAEEAYGRAHELGRDPQPGLALLRLARGRAQASAAALTHLPVPRDRLERCRLLAARVEVFLALGQADEAGAAADELRELADGWRRLCGAAVTLPHAAAASAEGAVAYARGDPGRARERLHRALALWLELGVPYDAAQTRMTLAAAGRAAGDEESARLELRAAHGVFVELGAVPDARRAAALLDAVRDRPPGGLTAREVQVLRLVAAGRTNRAVAEELVISEHTVARHLNNIFAKLDVSSRAAATAYAYTHGLV
ncbi:LuxR C-terminal-related transcriptional regulator [Streptomyces sp. NBC_00582]|uniref:LuxR C-terminal-related transcriptional regulator n=1 Tax=Streptomyces sp. NBC_00582 TaxID=2975783 RepID=UPI002E81F9A2|nr:LuxR C-terminal-related transcriptional regulator [Streptomyces sp. NBC_00582]WUB60158.1 LuxR C-terminal-related transcriptional regulator [Streptomyces sp. NBC_00582]